MHKRLCTEMKYYCAMNKTHIHNRNLNALKRCVGDVDLISHCRSHLSNEFKFNIIFNDIMAQNNSHVNRFMVLYLPSCKTAQNTPLLINQAAKIGVNENQYTSSSSEE